jgi:hypothetical protein
MAKKEMMDSDMAQDKKLIKKAIAMHDKQEHKGEHTNLSKLRKGGMAKKMAKGGVTGQAMRAVGRNMARANNQKSK